jgi:septum formation protein
MPALVVLASSSPRRKEILASLSLRFEVRAAEVDESLLPAESAFDAAERLARAKVAAVLEAAFGSTPDALVVAADTLVVLDGAALGKPRDRADARRMLSALAGRAHDVVTGVACARGGRVVSGRETTRVVFAPMSQTEIVEYAETGEPDDKAGAYALQGIGGLFVERVEGSPSNVVGLPVRLLYRLASELGVDLARGVRP